ncbi:MAG: membrane dipeptidase [Bacteroidetes bacterium]|nr:membrane dipeptidase [Bacteroidota bacterium]
MKKILRITLIVIGVLAVLFFLIAPGYIDRTMNTTVHKNVKIQKVSWYDSIPFIADLHCDALLWNRNLLKRSNIGHVDIPRMQEANAAFEVFTVVSKTPRGINYDKNSDKTDQVALLSFAQLRRPSDWFSIKTRALGQCEQLHEFAKKSGGIFRVITNQQELKQLVNDRSANRKLTAGMLGIEGAQCLENEINNLDAFYNAGVRYIGLTHFFDNEWGGSAHGINKGGLTEKGRELLKKMQEKHIIIDLAHASPKLIDDIFANTNCPLLVSHTGVKGVCDNVRNLSDAQIMEIGRRNGLIGIGMWETAVCGTDADATAKSIKYVADKIGVDKVAMGSDFDGAIEASYDITGFPLIVNALLKEGFSRADIEKIMGGNVRDFLLKNLPAQ